ncbi:prepilin-type N-terminal cleavage/methylation domain-containing protein [Planctomycetota bacterium]|nr:prepilin-type N-terminal cleavage/methylation domain-containing protein [Planctomycetota bacterium]
MRRTSLKHNTAGFTLIELMVAISLLLVLGVIVIGIMTNAMHISRGATARGKAFESAQTLIHRVHRDFSQIVGSSAHPAGSNPDMAFTLAEDPYGRQIIGFNRAWGEENKTLAGFDAGRGSGQQGWNTEYNGRNPTGQVRPSGGNLEVVYMFEPVRDSLRLYRAERAVANPANGLLTAVGAWAFDLEGSDADQMAPMAAIRQARIGGESLWDQFELVADNIVAFSIEAWDDDFANAQAFYATTMSWFAGTDGPVTRWRVSQRLADRQFPLPKAVRLTLIVASDDPVRAETDLLATLGRGQTSMSVDDTQGFPDLGSGGTYLRVNGELIAYGGKSDGLFTSLARGALGSREQDHMAGDKVIAGDAFVKVIQIPVTR